jgi:uncharacterized protein
MAYANPGKIMRIEATGGPAQTVTDFPALGYGGGSWNQSGLIVFSNADGGDLFQVPAAGGTPVRIAQFDVARHEWQTLFPSFLPDGHHSGPLNASQIEIIKNWIDQGAQWSDDASGETPPPPPDAKAAHLMQALRESDTQAVSRVLADDPKVVTRKGPGGSTPLMYAALYSDAATLRRFLEAGADPNVPNDAGATALMWAAGDLEKTRLLLDRGAKVNARSDAGRTALLIAAGRMNNAAVVKALLDRGADPKVESPGLFFPMTPLAEAASTGDPNLVQTLIDRGADTKAAGLGPGFFALASGCARCGEVVVKPPLATPLAVMLAPPLSVGSHIPQLLAMGAEANAKDPGGTPLIVLASSNDETPTATDAVKSLIAHGADLNAKNAAGETALDQARKRGDTALVKLLVEAGAK